MSYLKCPSWRCVEGQIGNAIANLTSTRNLLERPQLGLHDWWFC